LAELYDLEADLLPIKKEMGIYTREMVSHKLKQLK
jgi:hypothetical protein